ncbi:MAG: FAD-dependent oxidoreductase [Candidatus Saccharimonadales bacterium]
MEKNEEVHETVMIGAGPTSLTAAIYTTREDIETLVLDKGVIGGLAAVTDWIDNYPGFPDGIAGLDLSEKLQKQAERFGAKIDFVGVDSLAKKDNIIELQTTSGPIKAKTVLIATGSDYKRVGCPGEDEFYARGVHYCATCDGAFYRDKRLVVVGGGNSAVQETLFLTRYASHIDLLVRSKFRASEVLINELEKHKDKVTVHLGTSTDSINGKDGKVVSITGTKDGKKVELKTDGVFVFVGLKPNTEFLAGSGIELDEIGMVKSDESLQTNIKGIFAAGDVRSGATMQIASAAGEGATAALNIRKYLEDMERNE